MANGKQYSQRPAVSLSWAIGCEQSFTRGIVMNIGDLITHNPTGAVGTIIADYGDRVVVYWCVDGDNDGDYVHRKPKKINFLFDKLIPTL